MTPGLGRLAWSPNDPELKFKQSDSSIWMLDSCTLLLVAVLFNTTQLPQNKGKTEARFSCAECWKAWNNTVPFRSGERFGIAGFSFLCLSEWQLHPSSWVKWAIYKSFSTFFLFLSFMTKLSTAFNFTFFTLWVYLLLSISSSSHHHPGLCSCDLHLDGSSCLTRMPDPPLPANPLSSLQPEWSFQITNLMTMSCLLPHKLLISLVVYVVTRKDKLLGLTSGFCGSGPLFLFPASPT